jgi:hypothetical protein
LSPNGLNRGSIRAKQASPSFIEWIPKFFRVNVLSPLREGKCAIPGECVPESPYGFLVFDVFNQEIPAKSLPE